MDNFTEILETTLRIVFDLLLVFGFETFSEDKSAVEVCIERSILSDLKQIITYMRT